MKKEDLMEARVQAKIASDADLELAKQIDTVLGRSADATWSIKCDKCEKKARLSGVATPEAIKAKAAELGWKEVAGKDPRYPDHLCKECQK
jgi:hypothetical protein